MITEIATKRGRCKYCAGIIRKGDIITRGNAPRDYMCGKWHKHCGKLEKKEELRQYRNTMRLLANQEAERKYGTEMEKKSSVHQLEV